MLLGLTVCVTITFFFKLLALLPSMMKCILELHSISYLMRAVNGKN